MKVSGKDGYDKVVAGLSAMIHQTVAVHLSTFTSKNEKFTRSARAGVMNSFEVAERGNSSKLKIRIFFEGIAEPEDFNLSDFEISLIPTAHDLAF